MPTKLSYETVYNYIRDKGYELLSKEYITSILRVYINYK